MPQVIFINASKAKQLQNLKANFNCSLGFQVEPRLGKESLENLGAFRIIGMLRTSAKSKRLKRFCSPKGLGSSIPKIARSSLVSIEGAAFDLIRGN